MAKKKADQPLGLYLADEKKAEIQATITDARSERVYSSTKSRDATKAGGKHQRSFRHSLAHDREDAMIDAIDMRRNMEKLVPLLDKFGEGKIDVQGFLNGVSGHMTREMLTIAMSGDSEKNRLDALKHLLGIAGHSPTQKHEIGRIDPSTPKEALLAIIRGSKRDLEDEGIEVTGDEPDKPEGA